MKCPGQDLQYWKPGSIFDVPCPECGQSVEFFKDDPSRKCGHCGHRFVNPQMDFGCAAYCQYAEQCLGGLPGEVVELREDLLKDRVAVAMKQYFKSDFKRIGHASRVARYAERIGREEGGNLAVILVTAYLHDIGIPEAERKYGSSAPRYQEKEGPPVAEGILKDLGARDELIREVCDIIAHHHRPGDNESLNFQVVYDADRIANIEEEMKLHPKTGRELSRIIENQLLTDGGRKAAREIFEDSLEIQ